MPTIASLAEGGRFSRKRMWLGPRGCPAAAAAAAPAPGFSLRCAVASWALGLAAGRSALGRSRKVPSSLASASDLVLASAIRCVTRGGEAHEARVGGRWADPFLMGARLAKLAAPRQAPQASQHAATRAHHRLLQKRKALHVVQRLLGVLRPLKHHPGLAAQAVRTPRHNLQDAAKLAEDAVHGLPQVCGTRHEAEQSVTLQGRSPSQARGRPCFRLASLATLVPRLEGRHNAIEQAALTILRDFLWQVVDVQRVPLVCLLHGLRLSIHRHRGHRCCGERAAVADSWCGVGIDG